MAFLAAYVDTLSPTLVDFGHGIAIRYYGLAYLLGFVGCYLGVRWQARLGWSPLSLRQVDDLAFLYVPLGVLVGGRLGYCLLYDWPETVRAPWTIFAVWRGGMASHGGMLGVIAALFFFARRNRLPFYVAADAAAICTPIGLGLGRIANFINGELWGRPTNVPWAVVFPKAPPVDGVLVPRHPSQLYEAVLEGVLLFLVLLWVRRRTLHPRRDGVVALTFLAVYALFRIVVECFREPDLQIGYLFGIDRYGFLTQGQLLSFLLLGLTGVLALFQRGQWKATA
jgi:phosphatidylglycerol:prolipoprotein diacylglycerol transferase